MKRYLVTMLSPKITDSLQGLIISQFKKVGLAIETINTPVMPIKPSLDCEVLHLVVSCANPISNEVKSSLLIFSNHQALDIIIRDKPTPLNQYKLIVFDLDSTLIQTEVIDELARAAGVYDKVSLMTQEAMLGKIDFKESFIKRLSLLKGLKKDRLYAIADALPLTKGAMTLVAHLKKKNYQTAIISGGFDFFAEHIQRRLSIDHMFSNTLTLDKGVVTGEAKLPIMDGDLKAKTLKNLALKCNIPLSKTIAVGDGANDLSMLKMSGLPIAYHAKPILQENISYRLNFVGLDGILHVLSDT